MMRFPLPEFPLHPKLRLEYSHELPLQQGFFIGVVCCMESTRKLWVHLHGFLNFASPRHSKTIAAMIQKSLKERHLQHIYTSHLLPHLVFSEDIELPKIKWFTATLQDYFLRPEVRRGAQSAEEALQLFKSIEEMRMVTVVEMVS